MILVAHNTKFELISFFLHQSPVKEIAGWLECGLNPSSTDLIQIYSGTMFFYCTTDLKQKQWIRVGSFFEATATKCNSDIIGTDNRSITIVSTNNYLFCIISPVQWLSVAMPKVQTTFLAGSGPIQKQQETKQSLEKQDQCKEQRVPAQLLQVE
jgi:hypothetical protein